MNQRTLETFKNPPAAPAEGGREFGDQVPALPPSVSAGYTGHSQVESLVLGPLPTLNLSS